MVIEGMDSPRSSNVYLLGPHVPSPKWRLRADLERLPNSEYTDEYTGGLDPFDRYNYRETVNKGGRKAIRTFNTSSKKLPLNCESTQESRKSFNQTFKEHPTVDGRGRMPDPYTNALKFREGPGEKASQPWLPPYAHNNHNKCS